MTYSQITRLLNWSAITIALSLVALVSYQLYVRHFVQITTSSNYQFDDLPGAAEVPVTADIDKIINKHIFGMMPEIIEPRQPEVVKVEPRPAPKTRLNIKLTGIIDGSTAQSGMAMMEVDRGRTVVVAVGEKIDKTDAVLHQVLAEEILIDRDGTIESVKMVRKTLSIAKLESDLFDSLPQPYIEDHNLESYSRPKVIPSPPESIRKTPPPAGQYGKPEMQNTAKTTPDNGFSISAPPPRRTTNEPMKTLPIPRMLQ